MRQFISNPSTANNTEFKIARAKARKTIRAAKRDSWQNYVSSLNSRTTSKQVWDRIKKIEGKATNPVQVVVHLQVDGRLLTAMEDIVNAMAESFCKASSSGNYSEEFKRHKTCSEKNKLNFISNNTESYNKPFTIHELRHSINNSPDGSTGPDEIHYQFIKNLPQECLWILLDVFNNLWDGGEFPAMWRESIVIPILKPGKDVSDPSSYRPISLTSCLCKTMERMVNRRLVHFLESNQFLTNVQCGFRQGRSTTDHLVRLETWIREGIATREHVVAVFFDLEKAYDTTWKYGIMKDLHHLGLRGKLPIFIDSFLKNRTFRVRMGAQFSDYRTIENGVPQGSILSVTLFGLKINDISQCAVDGVNNCLFVDDFAICCRSKNMRSCERKLQLTLNNLQRWSVENGFKFSTSKTAVVHFCNQRRLHPDPQLTLNGTILPVENQIKFLGVIFDNKLTFVPHLKALKQKCMHSLNLLRVVGHKDWGGDFSTLIKLYRTLVRSKLDYGCVVYGSARKSYLQMLDPIQNRALRLSLGAFRTSPVESLRVEASEPSLSLRRQKISAKSLC